MSIKVYLHLELPGYPEKTSKLTIPKSWVANKAVSDVISLFLEGYAAANPTVEALVSADVHLETAPESGLKIQSDKPIQGTLEDHGDYFVIKGVHISAAAATSTAGVPGGEGGEGGGAKSKSLKCKNYGCGKAFVEEENSETACHFHSMPPYFRDTVKGWQCCPDKKALDWDEFQVLPTCCVGRHSLEEKQSIFQSSPTVAAAEAASATSLKSISDFNSQNPSAVTAASAAVKAAQTRKSTRKDDGTAKCLNKGCQKVFNFAENVSDACLYHAGQAIFHDSIKYWSCCSEKKCYDFESFLQVTGCTTGYHDDGVIDLEALASSASSG